MSLLPPAFKDPAFAPLGPPIKRRATFAQMREAYTEAQRYNALEDFECENHGNADEGCLQEPCMPPTGKEVIAHYRKVAGDKWSTKAWLRGDFGVDIGREGGDEIAVAIRGGEIGRLVPVGVLGPHEMLDADVAHMRESKPSPKLESALNAAQAALVEHLFGEAKKVKDPFEKAAMKLRAKDAERAVQMKTKADIMLREVALAVRKLTPNEYAMKLLEADAERVCNPPAIVPF